MFVIVSIYFVMNTRWFEMMKKLKILDKYYYFTDIDSFSGWMSIEWLNFFEGWLIRYEKK